MDILIAVAALGGVALVAFIAVFWCGTRRAPKEDKQPSPMAPPLPDEAYR